MRKTIISFLLVLLFAGCRQKQDAGSIDKVYALYDEAKYDEALQQINHLIASHKDSALFYDLRGSINKKTGDMEAALADYDKAISLQPNDAFYFGNRADLFYSLKKPEESIRDYNRALKYEVDDTTRYFIINNRGNAKAMKRDFQGAYEDFIEVLAFDSTEVSALTNLGAVLDNLNRGNEAFVYLERAIRLYPKETTAIGNLGFRYMGIGDYERAITLFNQVLEISPEDPFAYNNRGFARYKQNDLEHAMQDIQRSIELKPDNSYAFKNRALFTFH